MPPEAYRRKTLRDQAAPSVPRARTSVGDDMDTAFVFWRPAPRRFQVAQPWGRRMIGWLRRRRERREQARHARQAKPIAAETYPRNVAARLQGIADEFGLSIQLDPEAPIEVSMTFHRQPGLQRDIQVYLQNEDEVWFIVDGFTYSALPYPEVWPTFEAHLRGVIRGTCMVQHNGRLSSRMALEDCGWTRVATYGGTHLGHGWFRNDPDARDGGITG